MNTESRVEDEKIRKQSFHYEKCSFRPHTFLFVLVGARCHRQHPARHPSLGIVYVVEVYNDNQWCFRNNRTFLKQETNCFKNTLERKTHCV